MKKVLSITAILFTAINFSWGQFKIIIPSDPTVYNDSTVVIHGNTVTTLISTFDVINSGIAQITVFVRRDLISVPVDTDNCFCWAGYCFASTTDVSLLSETIGVGDTAQGANQFNGHFTPYGFSGSSLIRYSFYNSNNHNDSAWVIVNYVTSPTGIATLPDKTDKISPPYPNPASNLVNFGYSLAANTQSANLKIFNLLGECVNTLPLNVNSTKTAINVQSIPSGVYICELQAGGYKSVYQKMVVSH